MIMHLKGRSAHFTESIRCSLFAHVTMGLVVLGFSVVGLAELSRAESRTDSSSLAAAPTQTAQRSQKKSTELSFDDVLVQGKFHFSDEAVTTVEDDKFLDALLTVRKDFKDRIKKSSSRH